MMRRLRMDPSARFTPRVLAVVVALLGLGFVAAVLVPGFELASELADTTAALKFVGEQQRYPDIIRTSLETMRDRLNARGYVEPPLQQLRDAAHKFDDAQAVMERARPKGWLDTSSDTAAFAQPVTAKHAAALRALWAPELESLQPLLGFTSVPYQDDESSGTRLNESGRELLRDANAAVRSARRLLPAIDGELSVIGADLQARNTRSAMRLRIVMLGGLAIAVALVLMVAVLLTSRRRQAYSLRHARQQTEDILRTVKDGLFLLDRDLVIGPTYSRALEGLFQRKEFAGLGFDDLLRDIVAERTLATARKFVSVLWSERTNENLVKSINPLGEVEVRIVNSQGSVDTRYLEFDFHRVRMDGKITHVLVSVSDITTRVDLARELTASQGQAQAQVDTLLGILHVEAAQLTSFLSDTDASMKMINAVLREPAREEAAFRKKLDRLFRQAHSVKGEAASLGLSSIEGRAHAFEDDLKALREKTELSGNDFLPLVIKLDDLLTHLQSIKDLVARVSQLQMGAQEAARAGGAENAAPSDSQAPVDIAPALKRLATRIADENDKAATLQCIGFETIPNVYRRLIKDVAVQAVRNAIVHGIEPRALRQNLGKSPVGAVKLEFQEMAEAYKFTIEDDGQGLSPERIKEAAVHKGILTPQSAATLDAKQAFSLLFQAGFSMVERVTKDAGRGIGMNLIAERVREAGGRVSVATQLGKYTRISVALPPITKRVDVTEAA
jgi:two-component system, chemotaxis family, sensor kinase CheA